MASVTLAEASKLGLDDLKAGVIENIVTVNPMYNVMPFMPIAGNAMTFNRENVLGDIQLAAIDGTITAKAAATFTKVTATLTTIVGDAEVNGLIQSQLVDTVNHRATQIASKAKAVGREYQRLMVLGDSANANEFDGLTKLITTAGQIVAGGSGALTFGMMDDVIQKVQAKEVPDFIIMHGKMINKLKALLRGLGGTTAEYVAMGDGMVLMYDGIPIFRNDWIKINAGAGTDEHEVYAGCWDDSSGKVGISGLTAAQHFGIGVDELGFSETKDNTIDRVKFYAGFTNFHDLALARITAVTV